MGAVKDLITDKKFKLTEIAKVEVPAKKGRVKEEEAYTYMCEETGAVVTFCAHPTEAWNWFVVLSKTNDLGSLVAPNVIEAFTKAIVDDKCPDFLEL